MADIRKKVFLPFFDCLKLVDCSSVRSYVGIPYEYRNSIAGILNV
jgi:hypothetical protein